MGWQAALAIVKRQMQRTSRFLPEADAGLCQISSPSRHVQRTE